MNAPARPCHPHPDNVQIRLAQASDIGPAKAILDEERRVFGFIPRPALADAQRRQSLLVAVCDHRVVGFAHLRHRRDQVTTLAEIAVAPDLRRRGIGRVLVQAVVDAAMQQRQRLVRLKCPVDLPANAFYARLGFTLSGQEPGKRVAVNVWSLVPPPASGSG